MFDYVTDLESLLWTGVVGKKWPKRTYLIAVVKTDNGVEIFKDFFKNKPNFRHAEEVMLNDDGFLKAVAHNSNIEVILTLNYSPCSECAKILKTFYESRKKKITKFIIQFSYLYYIKNEKNKNGLRNLNEAGVTLQAMNPNSWRELEVGIDLDDMERNDRERITKLPAILSHRRSSTVSLETYPLYSFPLDNTRNFVTRKKQEG